MKRMVSGIKPTGKLTLGNYIGAIKPFVKYQDEYELFVFVADLHALTIRNDPDELRVDSEAVLLAYLAAGLDPDKACIFRQSDIKEHAALEWVLTCNTNLAELTKMPQYKNYLDKHKNEAVPAGMLVYPSLMNADILLYDADYVPVGLDQKPHVDLTRDIAEKFNSVYGETFVLPEALIPETGAKIMSLADPTKKMSKSESDKGTIYLTDDEETVKRKFRKAVTDGEGKIYFDKESKPGISNLLTILSCVSGKEIKELEVGYSGEKDYGKFKADVADAVWNALSKLQEKIAAFKEKQVVDCIFEKGKAKAEQIARKKLQETYRKIGLR